MSFYQDCENPANEPIRGTDGQEKYSTSHLTVGGQHSFSFHCLWRNITIIDELPHDCPYNAPNPSTALNAMLHRGWERMGTDESWLGLRDLAQQELCMACNMERRSESSAVLRYIKGDSR